MKKNKVYFPKQKIIKTFLDSIEEDNFKFPKFKIIYLLCR